MAGKPLGLPKIGMRIVKSAVAVLICFLVDFARGGGVPFYSAIAAVLCMQPYVSGSKKAALNRCVGTFLGGAAGMLVLLLERRFLPRELPLLRALIVSAMIIPLIYLTVLVKKPSASYITTVVFMSVTVAHGADVNPYLFALNRVIDTLVGIGVSLGVNMARLPRRRDRGTLYIAGLDGALPGPDGKLGSYTRIKLGQLIERGALVAVATHRFPAAFLPLLEGVPLNLPVIALGGAALYDPRAKTFSDLREIPHEAAMAVKGVFDRRGLNCFVCAVLENLLHLYYSGFTNRAERDFYDGLHPSPHEGFVRGPLPEGHGAVCVLALDTEQAAGLLLGELEALPGAGRLRFSLRPDPAHPGYAFLAAYDAGATMERAAGALKARAGARRVTAFAGDPDGAPLLRAADRGYAVAGAGERVREAADAVLTGAGGEAVARAMEKLYLGKRVAEG